MPLEASRAMYVPAVSVDYWPSIVGTMLFLAIAGSGVLVILRRWARRSPGAQRALALAWKYRWWWLVPTAIAFALLLVIVLIELDLRRIEPRPITYIEL